MLGVDVAPVPPRATPSVPVVIFPASRFGTSAATSARNVGVAATPVVGPLNTVLAVCVASVPVNVPEVVTGEPLTVIIDGSDKPTLVTVPPDPVALIVGFPETPSPFVIDTPDPAVSVRVAHVLVPVRAASPVPVNASIALRSSTPDIPASCVFTWIIGSSAIIAPRIHK